MWHAPFDSPAVEQQLKSQGKAKERTTPLSAFDRWCMLDPHPLSESACKINKKQTSKSMAFTLNICNAKGLYSLYVSCHGSGRSGPTHRPRSKVNPSGRSVKSFQNTQILLGCLVLLHLLMPSQICGLLPAATNSSLLMIGAAQGTSSTIERVRPIRLR